jgi:hypothetical protein
VGIIKEGYMKKEFKLTDPKKAPARQVDAVKHEIKKYLARERRKNPQDGADYWDFDCKLGKEKDSAAEVHVAEINKGIDKVVAEGSEKFYIEIQAKPGYRAAKKIEKE